jgi:hypothetical protein
VANGDSGPNSEPRAVRVAQTRIALVHEGELIFPGAGSEAEVEQVSDDTRATIIYYFPVEVEVRAAAEAVNPQDIVGQTLDNLIDGLGSLG